MKKNLDNMSNSISINGGKPIFSRGNRKVRKRLSQGSQRNRYTYLCSTVKSDHIEHFPFYWRRQLRTLSVSTKQTTNHLCNTFASLRLCVHKKPKNKLAAFTLTEMLMVLAIIGILLMLVMPNQASTVAQAKAIEAQQNLNHIFALEKNYFFMHSKYSNSLEEVGFEQLSLVTEGGQAKYKISILEASATSFMAQAEAVVDFDGDGQYNVWTIDQNQNLKEVTKD